MFRRDCSSCSWENGMGGPERIGEGRFSAPAEKAARGRVANAHLMMGGGPAAFRSDNCLPPSLPAAGVVVIGMGLCSAIRRGSPIPACCPCPHGQGPGRSERDASGAKCNEAFHARLQGVTLRASAFFLCSSGHWRCCPLVMALPGRFISRLTRRRGEAALPP